MARLLCLIVCFFISLGFEACVSGSNVPVSPSPTVIPPCSPEECTCGSGSSVTVHFNTSVLTVVEGSSIDIQLVAKGKFCKSFTVNLTFTDGTARYLMDYFYLPLITPSVTFTSGSISSSVFRVTLIANNIWEGAKSFEVGFVLPSCNCPNLNSGRPDTLRVNIADDDSVHISFQRSTQTVREDSGSVKLRLQSRGRYGTRFSVSFTCIQVFPVEAKDGEDFTGGVYTVEFQTLVENKTVSSTAVIPIVDDSISEPTESFICVILRPRGEDGIVVKDPNTLTVIIEDDDPLQISFEKAIYSGEEGKVISEIRLKATPFKRPFSVQIFATTLDASRPEKDCEATSGVDYTDPRSLGGGVVRFSPAIGLVSSTLTIPILSDNIAEGTEYFGLSFVALSNGDELGIMAVEPTMAIVAINDTTEIFVRFNSFNFEIDEDTSSLDAYFEVVREVSPGVYVPAEYTFDFRLQVTTIAVVGSAIENVDFEDTVGNSVTFSAGQQFSTPFSVNITDGTLCEGPEQFTVSYSIISSSVRSGANVRQLDTTATVVINDNNMTVHFNTSMLTIVEGSSIDIQLVAQGTFCKNFTVNLTFTDGTARYLVDYIHNPFITPSVTFTPGSISSSVFGVITIPNNVWEGTKSFEVGFVLPYCPNLNSGSPDTLRVNIADDDSVQISFQNSTQTVREDSGSIPLQLQSCGLYGRRFSVSFTCIPVFPTEAKDGEDFTGGVYTVEFQTLGAISSVSSMVEIPIVNNSKSECNESFICVILRPRGEDGIVVKDPNTITIVIEDDDLPLVSFVESNVTGGEGDVVKLRVNRTGSITKKLKCKVRTESITAEKGVDFHVKKKSVVFNKLYAESEVRTVRVKLLTGNTNCLRVVLECKPKDLIGYNKPSTTVCIQGN